MSKEDLSITLYGKEIPIARRVLPVSELQFYPENPRVYSIVHSDGDDEPDQEKIQKALQRMEHVKALISAIRKNGGVTDPLLVKEKEGYVLEGNSRLAAYHVLKAKDPINFSNVKCDVVTADINNNEVRALLASYHIIGRKDWDPFEQAGMFYRWYMEGKDFSEIASAVEGMGISSKKVRHWVNVYELMVKEKDTKSNRWSFYDELIKSRDIAKAGSETPTFIPTVINQIKSGKITKADDIRKKVAKVAKGGKKLVKNYVKNKDLNKSYESAVAGGAENALYNRLCLFRTNISHPDTIKNLESMNQRTLQKSEFELTRILKRIKYIIDKIDNIKE